MVERVAVVSGTSSGLGLEMAQYLLDCDYTVYGFSRRETDLDHEQFIDLEVDISNEEQVAQAFEQLQEEVSGIHLLVNNAAVMNLSPVHEQSSDDFLNHLTTNTLGAFHLLKYVYPLLIEQKSHIIHLSSIGGKKGFPEASAYCASKFALEGLVESVRREWSDLGIRFTNLNPGAIDTPLWDSMGESFDRSKMLDPEDFLHVFEMVIQSPSNMQFPELCFLHRQGSID